LLFERAVDEIIGQVLRNWDGVMGVMLPTLREERRATYSPVLPVSPTTGKVLQVPVQVLDAEAGTIRFTDEDGSVVEQSALGGTAKLQWKVDWAARWVALGVDYEMAGKDLIDSVVQSGKIAACSAAARPRASTTRCSSTRRARRSPSPRATGLSLEEWLRYGSEPSLAFYIYREPKRAKSLHIGVIPRAVDEYCSSAATIPNQPLEQKLGNPVPPHPRRRGAGARAAANLRLAAQPRQPARRRRQGHRLEASSSATRPARHRRPTRSSTS
jgi:lysyl-tRNA synthetase class 1